MASTGQVGRFLGATTFGALTFGLVCGQLGVLSLGCWQTIQQNTQET